MNWSVCSVLIRQSSSPHLLQVGEEVGHLDPRLSALLEGELVLSGSPQEIGVLADEGQFGGIEELIRAQLPVSLLELRLVVEEVEVGGRTDQVNIDDVLGAWSVVESSLCPCRLPIYQ